MKRLTAEEIQAVWKEAALTYGLDPATNDTQAGKVLFRQPLDKKNLPATLAAMEIVRPWWGFFVVVNQEHTERQGKQGRGRQSGGLLGRRRRQSMLLLCYKGVLVSG